MDLNLLLRLPEDYAHLPMVRRVTREVLGSFGVNGQDIDDIELLVGELATNAVRHARSAGGFRLEVSLDGERATVTVADEGVGFDPGRVGAPGSARPDDGGVGGGEGDDAGVRFGGWGLPLVESVADEVEFAPNHPCGTRVRAVKRLTH